MGLALAAVCSLLARAPAQGPAGGNAASCSSTCGFAPESAAKYNCSSVLCKECPWCLSQPADLAKAFQQLAQAPANDERLSGPRRRTQETSEEREEATEASNRATTIMVVSIAGGLTGCFCAMAIFYCCAMGDDLDAPLIPKDTRLAVVNEEDLSQSVGSARAADPAGALGLFTGIVDAQGLPHGRGVMTYDKGGLVFCGEFCQGMMFRGVVYARSGLAKSTVANQRMSSMLDTRIMKLFPRRYSLPEEDRPPEFAVSIVKDRSSPLGLRCTEERESKGPGLVVKSVADGPLRAWNAMHPDREVRHGDRVVAVNGTRGSQEDLARAMEAAESSRRLELAVLPGPMVNDQLAPVVLSACEGGRARYYCGRAFIWGTIPGTDRCGPARGPQCPSCARLEGARIRRKPQVDAVPRHWTNAQVGSGSFDLLVYAIREQQSAFSALLASTYQAKATRDRPCPTNSCPKTRGGCPCVQPGGSPGLPTGYRVQRVVRVEDSATWTRYVRRRSAIRAKRTPTGEALERVRPPVMTEEVAKGHPGVFSGLEEDVNEAYLWHGTSVRRALAIARSDFQIDLAGSTAGTMFGRGIYLAESSTKADEYARDEHRGHYRGVFALVLCRVCLGRFFYTTDADQSAGDQVASGGYDSTCGDRTKSAKTFREFVVYDSNQLYPEYVVLYTRAHGGIEADLEAAPGERLFHAELPIYWANCHRNLREEAFNVHYVVRPSTRELLQQLVLSALPNTNMAVVLAARRVENSRLWNRYAGFKLRLREKLKSSSGVSCRRAELRVVLGPKMYRKLHARLDRVHGRRRLLILKVASKPAQIKAGALPGEELQPRDRIIEVNGRRGSQLQLKQALWDGMRRGRLELVVERVERTAREPGRSAFAAAPGADLVQAQALAKGLQAALSLEDLEPSLNERLLWHGTSKQTAEAMVGTAARKPRCRRRVKAKRKFGMGAYLTEDLAESMNHAQETPNRTKFILLCRVLLGDVYNMEEEDEQDADKVAQQNCNDCVLVNPDTKGPRKFVVLSPDQVYPEYILELHCSECQVDAI